VKTRSGGYRPTPPVVAPRRGRLRYRSALASVTVILAAGFFAYSALRPADARDALTTPLTGTPLLGAPGRWGQFELTPIEIEPPEELGLKINEIPPWFFAQRTRAQVLELFREAGLPAADISGFEQLDGWEQSRGGTTLRPAFSRVIALAPAARARIHAAAGRSPDDPRPHRPIPIALASLDRHLEKDGFDARTKQLVNTFVVRRGAWGLLWDMDALAPAIGDEPTRRRVIRTLLTSETFLVRVRVDAKTDLAAFAQYWRIDGANDLRPLFQSVAKLPGGGSVGLSELLPPFARSRINRYPNYMDSVESGSDCLWTALNFFRPQPDTKVRDVSFMIKALGTDYTPIPGGATPTFGDVVVLLDTKTVPVHAAVYLADDLVFTKNGADIFRPWIVMRRPAMVELYQTLQRPVREVVVRAVDRSHH
jgi:hypothetical protein